MKWIAGETKRTDESFVQVVERELEKCMATETIHEFGEPKAATFCETVTLRLRPASIRAFEYWRRQWFDNAGLEAVAQFVINYGLAHPKSDE